MTFFLVTANNSTEVWRLWGESGEILKIFFGETTQRSTHTRQTDRLRFPREIQGNREETLRSYEELHALEVTVGI